MKEFQRTGSRKGGLMLREKLLFLLLACLTQAQVHKLQKKLPKYIPIHHSISFTKQVFLFICPPLKKKINQ
jgi:hypothetical protein